MEIGRVVFDGILLSGIFFAAIVLILKINPRYEMKSYPPEIVNKVKPQTKVEKQKFTLLAVPIMTIMIVYLGVSLIITYDSPSYLTLLSHAFTALMMWNVFDLVILDWLIFCKINPDFMILPGTKGNPAYQDYFYHFVGFFKGTGFCFIGTIVLGTIVYFVKL